jgi:hypothetical protein
VTAECVANVVAAAPSCRRSPSPTSPPRRRRCWCAAVHLMRRAATPPTGHRQQQLSHARCRLDRRLTGAGGDNGTDHNQNWLRFPYVSTFWRSHHLPPQPYLVRCSPPSAPPPSPGVVACAPREGGGRGWRRERARSLSGPAQARHRCTLATAGHPTRHTPPCTMHTSEEGEGGIRKSPETPFCSPSDCCAGVCFSSPLNFIVGASCHSVGVKSTWQGGPASKRPPPRGCFCQLGGAFLSVGQSGDRFVTCACSSDRCA